MAIIYVGGLSNSRAGAVTTYSQSLSGTLSGGTDTSPLEGDLVLVNVAAASANSYRPTTMAVSGWNNLAFQTEEAVTNNSYQQISYLFMSATPETSITIPSTGNNRNAQTWTVQVFRNVDVNNPLAVVYATGNATGRPNPSAITPAAANSWILWLGSSAAATGATFTAPTDFSTNWLTNTQADTYDSSTGAGYYTGWSSGSYDPAAITAGGTTGSTDSWVAATIALRPGVLTKTITETATISENVAIAISLGTQTETVSATDVFSYELTPASGQSTGNFLIFMM